ncbi:disease resistance protein RGH2 [Striga asiatica]|uniref:Disease resistance protein RGH2 n=1 Tax=Striga asiatica TaxID=4170 RepID=A0A5A7RHW2_STRAF|nr:disease resistance protein RGH2 [Striga asiatica]
MNDDELVGRAHILKALKGKLLGGDEPIRGCVISGMTGIGKTALARCIYHDPYVRAHFTCRAWVTVSPKGNKLDDMAWSLNNKTLLVKIVTSPFDMQQLNKILPGNKYLVVIDNLGDLKTWQQVMRSAPNDIKGSRIIVTTQNGLIARDVVMSNGYVLRDPFLNDDDSWRLLHRVVFPYGSYCPWELESIGRRISGSCEGLPLAIIQVGKLLCGVDRTAKRWKEVEESDFLLNDPILLRKASLSYQQLPRHLQPCFLYVGLIPKGIEIRLSRIINLWVAEGFIAAQGHMLQKEVGRIYLIKLVARSLVQVLNYSSTDEGIKTCRVHVMYRGFCIKEARDEGFCHVIKKLEHANVQGTGSHPRLCFHNNIVLGLKQARAALESVSSACSLLCYGPRSQYPVLCGTPPLPFKLLNVLDAPAVRFYEFPDQVLGLVRLRYLAITYDGEIPSAISALCDLQVLIVHRHQIVRSSCAVANSYLPMEIWTLRKLRHLHCMGWDLPHPSTACFFLENLLSLSGVSPRSCTHGVLARMPKLEKVGVRVVPLLAHDTVETFAFFSNFSHQYSKFESFKCVVVGPDLGTTFASLVTPSFPIYIKKITLSGCRFPWEYIKVIAQLPNISALKLRQYAFQGPECLLSDLIFSGLTFLLMEDLDVENFICGIDSFPRLRRLRIRHCYKLKSINLGESIPYDTEVDDCGVVIENWARGFKKQHLDHHVHIRSSRNDGGSKNNS